MNIIAEYNFNNTAQFATPMLCYVYCQNIQGAQVAATFMYCLSCASAQSLSDLFEYVLFGLLFQ